MKDELNIIKKAFKLFVKQEHIPTHQLGTVVSYSAPNAVVTIAGNTTNITIPNKTNQSLVGGDKVVVVTLSGDLTNSFVGWKL